MMEENKGNAIPIKFRTRKNLIPLFRSLEGKTLVMDGLKIEEFERRFIHRTFFDVDFQLKPNGSKAEYELKEKAWAEKIAEIQKKFEPIIAENTAMADELAAAEIKIKEKENQIKNLQVLNRDYVKSINEKDRTIRTRDEKLNEYLQKEIDKWNLVNIEKNEKTEDYDLNFKAVFTDSNKQPVEKMFTLPFMVFVQLSHKFTEKESTVEVKEITPTDYKFTCNGSEYLVPQSFIEFANKKNDWFSDTLYYYGFNLDAKKTIENQEDAETSDEEEADEEVQETDEVSQNETQEERSEPETYAEDLKTKYLNRNIFPPLDDIDRKIIETMVEENLIEGNKTSKLGDLTSEVRRRNPDVSESIIQKRVSRHLLKNGIVLLKKAEDNPKHNEYFLKKMEV